MPLLFLPAKETVEVLWLKGERRMTKDENIKCTFILVFISYIFAIFVPSIGDAMALAGCTTNPMVRYSNSYTLDRIHYTSYAILEDPQ
jgi:amino acid permease